jgi:hypothetical protein
MAKYEGGKPGVSFLVSIETRNRIPDCVAPWWNEIKKQTVLCTFGGMRPRRETLFMALV